MTEPDRHLGQTPIVPGESAPKLEYGRGHSRRRVQLTPEEQRRVLLWCVAVTTVVMLAWWFAMFWTRRPAIDYLCVCAFMPGFLASAWLVLGWQLLMLLRRYPQPHRLRLILVMLLTFFLSPYSLMRAGSDAFTVSVRYHLWRAGGADKVRASFNQWVAGQPVYDAGSGRKLLFAQATSEGDLAALPTTAFPPEVRYFHDRFPSRFGMTWRDVAYLDNVSVLTTTDIMIGPPGWEPEGGATLWGHVLGSRRKLADGIWVQFGMYRK